MSIVLLIILQSVITLTASTKSTLERTWSNRLGVVLTPVATGLWAAERPFLWNGIDVGSRSVIARMPSDKEGGTLGGLLVHSPIAYDEELAAAIEMLGGEGVKAIVAPNYEHLKYSEQWANVFPNAKKWACPGLVERMPEVRWTNELGKGDCPSGFEALWFDCEKNPFTNKPFFNEVVFFHKQSRALFMADTFWNYPLENCVNYKGLGNNTGAVHKCSKVPIAEDYLPDVQVPFGTRAWKAGMDVVYKPFYKIFMVGTSGERRERYEECVKTLLSWKPDIIVPCHGDVIRGKDLVERVLREHFLS